MKALINWRPDVLILEDDSDVVTPSLLSALEQTGYNVHTLAPQRQRIATIVRLKPHAVLFNVGRRRTNAYEVAAELREKQELKGVLMIGIFGENGRNGSPNLENFDYCFVRPVNEGSLLAAINGRVVSTDFSGSPPALGEAAPHRVLLIDDHVPLAEATAEFMRCKGLEVRIASTGRDALEMAAAFQPEIVLCDVMLPDMSGLDLASALRAGPVAKEAVIALHTAMSESELRFFADHSDKAVNMFLSKPLTKERLDDLLSQLEILQRSAPSTRPRPAQKRELSKSKTSKTAG